MGPISADTTRYVRTREAAIAVSAPEVTALKVWEDPVWVSEQELALSSVVTQPTLNCFLAAITRFVTCFQ